MASRTNKTRIDTAKAKEQRREYLLKLLNSSKPIWKTGDHEKSNDSTNWVKAIRKESDARLVTVHSSDKERRNQRRKSL